MPQTFVGDGRTLLSGKEGDGVAEENGRPMVLDIQAGLCQKLTRHGETKGNSPSLAEHQSTGEPASKLLSTTERFGFFSKGVL